MAKDMICTPVILSMRSFIKHEFDAAWLHLSTTDTDTILYAAKKTSSVAARAADPDDLKITFRILNKILVQTAFNKYLETATVYGVRGERVRIFLLLFQCGLYVTLVWKRRGEHKSFVF